MATIDRYKGDSLSLKGLGTSKAFGKIRRALKNGEIDLQPYITKEDERLDKLAGATLGDGRLWWVIAICSNIGWGLQIPPGTVLRIPTNLNQIKNLV